MKLKNTYDDLGRLLKKERLYANTYDTLETYVYDDSSRVIEKRYGQTGTGRIKEVYTYDALDRISTKKVYNNTSTLLYTENYTYTSGKITVSTTAADGTVIAKKVTEYDAYGNVIKTEAVSDETTISTTAEYDYLNRTTKQTDANGNSTTYEYDTLGNVVKTTDAEGNVVTAQYDLAGQAISATDAKGNTTVTDYDKLGRAIKVTSPFNATGNAVSKTYYDKNSNVVKTAVKESGNVYQTQETKYDIIKNLIVFAQLMMQR